MSSDNIKIMEVELPSSRKLFQALMACRDAGPDELRDIQDSLLLPATSNWVEAVSRYYKIEFRDDPEILLEHLFKLQEVHSDLLGLCKAIFRRIKSDQYIKLLEAPVTDGKKALAHTALEYYARNEGAVLEGVESLLESKNSYIQNRIMTLRNSSSRY